MKKVLLERSKKAYLPQIDASLKYFNGKNLGFQLVDSAAVSDFDRNDFDCLWKFAGMDAFEKLNIPLIHEYASLSTGVLPVLKNKAKKILNFKPDLRIYLNSFVRDGIGFADHIPCVYRDMGVDDVFFQYKNTVKKYDCVYVGSITKERGIDRLLHFFKEQGKNRTILLIGKVADDLYKPYASCANITFTGDIAYQDVPAYASEAVCGINYMPAKYPFYLQTSTKLLEYLAMGLEILSTDYFWIRHFMNENQVHVHIVDEELRGLETALKEMEKSPQVNINMDSFKWSNVIEQSGLEQKLLEIL